MTLVISFGMLERLERVLRRDLGFSADEAAAIAGALAGAAREARCW